MNDFRNANLSVEEVVSDMRQSRNGVMVQTSTQLDELIKLYRTTKPSTIASIGHQKSL